MEILKQEQRYETTQYIVKDGLSEYAITEVLFTEDVITVFIYDSDSFCVGMFNMSCCRGIYAWSGMIWCTEDKNTDFDSDELSLIAGEIINAHNNGNEIIQKG